MNTLRLPFLFIFLVVVFTAPVLAQTDLVFESESAYAKTSPSNNTNKVSAAPSPYRFHKKLQQLFSGYAIEVAASNFPLERTNPIFRQFGNVHYDKLATGGYSYLILANFDSSDAGLQFLQTIIQPKVPEARLFLYKEGIRKIIRQ